MFSEMNTQQKPQCLFFFLVGWFKRKMENSPKMFNHLSIHLNETKWNQWIRVIDDIER